jgi:hypothetical protein
MLPSPRLEGRDAGDGPSRQDATADATCGGELGDSGKTGVSADTGVSEKNPFSDTTFGLVQRVRRGEPAATKRALEA